MPTALDCYRLGATALDLLAAKHAGASGLAWRQRQRLHSLLTDVAQGHSLYAGPVQALLRRSGPGPSTTPWQATLHQLPVHTKSELMQRFGEWVSDPRLTLVELQAFAADPARIAEPYLGQYTVWESSGSSGTPGFFVQDSRSMGLYDALELVRRSPPVPARRWLDPLFLGERLAFVGAIHGHFASIVSLRRLQRLNPWAAHSTLCLDILQPVQALVRALNAFAPTILSTYPSVATLLAEQQAQGHLRLALREVWTGGETLSPAARSCMADSFECAVRNHYGASEFFSLAAECAHGQLHANTDWALLEPVDEQHRAVPRGQPSATTLLTHLGNRVQPLIRYDLGDQLCVDERPCACGSPLPVIAVSGRDDPPLRLAGRHGQSVLIVPLALISVLEDQCGLFDFCLRQHDAQSLTLAVPRSGAAAQAQLAKAVAALQAFFATHGMVQVRIHAQTGVELPRGASGKACRVVSE